jgi:FtsZ-interacting cell division protein ZipA
MTGGLTKGQIIAGCIGFVLIFGIGYWALKKPDQSQRKKRNKSRKRMDTKKPKKTYKRKYSDSDSSKSSSDSSESSDTSNSSYSESESIELASKNRRKSRKDPVKPAKVKKSGTSKSKMIVAEPSSFEPEPLPSVKRASPLKVESVLIEKKKGEYTEPSQISQS